MRGIDGNEIFVLLHLLKVILNMTLLTNLVIGISHLLPKIMEASRIQHRQELKVRQTSFSIL